MIIFPDIEIQNGRSVNRVRGLEQAPEVYDISPLEAAKNFVAAGAEWLHVIDIDASLRRGDKPNSDLIRRIIDNVDVPVQVGGGIRTCLDVEWWLDHGATRVVLGTAAVVDRHMLMDVCGRHAGEIVVSINGKNGRVMIDGWRTTTSFSTLELARCFENSGAAAIIYNDLDRFEGGPEVGLAATIEIGAQLEIPLISTGTVYTLDDVSALSLLPNIEGVIVGRALFNGSVDLAEAIQTARVSRVSPELASIGLTPRYEEDRGLPIESIGHVGIRVRDLDRSVAFYERFGFAKVRQKTAIDNPTITLRHPRGAAINLLQSEQRGAPAIIGLSVGSLAGTRAFAEHHDLDFLDRPAAAREKALYVKDPDDNIIELCLPR